MKMVKTTVQYDAQGNVDREWKRLVPEASDMEAFVEGLCEDVRGKGFAPPRKSKHGSNEDELFEVNVYDPHIGMYADAEETLDSNYDTDIACSRVLNTVDALCARAGKPKKGLLIFGGDVLHGDSFSNSTPQSGHVLDIDTRYNRVVKFAKDTCREVIRRVAAVCEELEVLVIPGNHSTVSEVWLAMILDAYYESCPNVTVRTDSSPHKVVVWGNNLIAAAHGDKIPAAKWAGIIATKFAKEWGQTTFRYCHLGHFHSRKVVAPIVAEEHGGIQIEYLPAVTASDAWHSSSGFVGAQKGATAFIYRKGGGMIARLFEPV